MGFDRRAHTLDGRVLEKLAHRQTHAEDSIHATQELRRGEGVSTDVEEVVVAAHVAFFEAQDVFPDPDEQFLLLAPGCIGGARGDALRWIESGRLGTGRGRRELFSIDLAGRVLQRQLL